MNSSQLLYKISNLQYSIRRKEIEYNNAVKTNDQHNIDLSKADLLLLKEDFAKTTKEFNSIPEENNAEKTKSSKKPGKWGSFFNFKTAVNRK